MRKRIRKTIAGVLLASIGLGAVSGTGIKPSNLFTLTGNIANALDQNIAKLVAVSQKRVSDRRRLEWGSWHDDCDEHHHHHHHDHHKEHAWWTYAQRGGPHADANSDYKMIGETKYCKDRKEDDVESDCGGWSNMGGCECPMTGILGLTLRNEGSETLNLHTIEVSLRDGGKQLGWEEENGIDFRPGEELGVGVNRNWKWDNADTLIFNGNYLDEDENGNPKNVSFHLEPIEICDLNIGPNKNPIGWLALSPVHVTHRDGVVKHEWDGHDYGDAIKVAVVEIFKHNNNVKGEIICHDGWTKCGELLDPSRNDDNSDGESVGHWHFHDDSHGWHDDHGHGWHSL